MYRLSADAALRALLALDALPGDTSGPVLEFLRSLKTGDAAPAAAADPAAEQATVAVGADKLPKPE